MALITCGWIWEGYLVLKYVGGLDVPSYSTKTIK